VFKGLKQVKAEVFVVDNNSVDGSCAMVKEKFPQVILIENKINLGFSKANNQAIKLSNGRYVLLLNPDTFLREDTLEKCIAFCDAHEDAGGLGVKMIDGKGKFLPESKRSLPTPTVAFYKIFGLSSLFPRSRTFGKYHLGNLDENKVHKVDVLAGAFMLMRKSVLEKTGYLDEAFFMYGEDIDLSYRITQAGYNNYYYPESPIIHYKGESTKKGSINYVKVFYKAMIIFARKHFTHKNANIYSFLIHLAIYFRAAIGILHRLFLNLFEPVLDILLILAGFYFLTPVWEMYKSGSDDYFPVFYFIYAVPSYIAIWLFFVFFAGGYERKIKPVNLFKGIVWGTIAIILIYALLPESLRFSRALIILGSIWAILSVFVSRIIGSALFPKNRVLLMRSAKKRIATVGTPDESGRVLEILTASNQQYEFIGRISSSDGESESDAIGTLGQFEEIIRVNKIDELIFCSQDTPASDIIDSMLHATDITTEFKIAPPESVSVIGSNSIHTTGDLYVVDLNSLSKGVNKRKKRLFDIVFGVTLLLVAPIVMWFMYSPIGLLRNVFLVVAGKKSWVGVTMDGHHFDSYGSLKPGVLSPTDAFIEKEVSASIVERQNIMYAKDYKVINDWLIVFRAFKSLGR
jgi:GT2 family glycosyltransferase